MSDSYPLPWKLLPGLAVSVVTGRSRSFHDDSLAALNLLNPPYEVLGREHIPTSGPCLLTTNHYSRPGFNAWWITLALSGSLPYEVHWIMTASWVYMGKIYEAPIRRITTWLFSRLAHTYGFTTMPPVPPYTADAAGRASSVRHVLAYAKRTPNPVIGLAPEGTDYKGGILGAPPPGLGRFISHLAPLCQVILPAGVFEDGDHLCVQFGQPYSLAVPSTLTVDQTDYYVSQTVMRAIARQLPCSLQGQYR